MAASEGVLEETGDVFSLISVDFVDLFQTKLDVPGHDKTL